MRKFVWALALMGVACIASAQVGWSRYSVWISNDREAARVADCELGLFSESVTLGSAELIVGPGELPKLQLLGLPTRFVATLPNPLQWEKSHAPAREDYRTEYLRYDAIIAQYEAWRAAHPTVISRSAIATTVGGRTVWAYRIFEPGKFGSRTAARSVLINCGIHAREWISPAVGMHVFSQLVETLVNGSANNGFPSATAYYFIPVLNADGYEYCWTNNRLWRKNRRNNGNGTFGVDLNRNFSTGWGLNGGSSATPGSDTYRGPSAFSEPEAAGLRNLMDVIPPVAAFIDFHSYGQYVLWPWGYQTALAPDSSWLTTIGIRMKDAIAAQSGLNYTTGPTSTTLYIASGVTPDYVYGRFTTPAYTIELRDTGTNGFVLPASEIIPTQEEAWPAFRALVFNMFVR